MIHTLDEYINQYIQEAVESDKKVALHLKEIIPATTHLDERVFYEIIKKLKNKIDKGKDFKAFLSAKKKSKSF
jgi:anthranilate/para-aminobenzoate synthase component I